ncbi:MAG: chemotaxis protein CheA [Deltaproteobacteria bacterium]|nr:chemotaxis protein CheA [Deltaproteobacteria bacterium]
MNESMEKAAILVDELALKAVMLDPKDMEGLGAVLNCLDELADVFKNAGSHPFADLTNALKALCEELVLDKHPEPERTVKHLGDGVSLFQALIRETDYPEACAEKISGFVRRCGFSKTQTGTSKDSPSSGPVRDTRVAPDLIQDRELIEGFVAESLEHLSAIEVNVLLLEQDPENLEVLNAIFRPFHTVKGVSGFLNLTDINRLAHEVETLLDEARDNKLAVDETLTDLILDAVDLMKAMIEDLRRCVQTGVFGETDFELDIFLDRLRKIPVQVGTTGSATVQYRPRGNGTDTGDILVKKGVVSEQEVAEALEKQKKLGKRVGEILIQEHKVTSRDVVEALREQKRLRGVFPGGSAKKESAAFVKVDTQKLDNMMDMVGELVITQAMLDQNIDRLTAQDKQLYSNLSQMGRITSEIQRISMSLRMVPIKQTFHKMIRLVRDLSKKSGKLVDLEMIGEDTELDRNMVDEIYDPLVHMVRNAVDHGIEAPEVRKNAGKVDHGTLLLKAYHKGGNIVIEISEDGRGLDREKIVARAMEQGLISSAEGMSDQDVYSLIFQPGFSTADKITDVSGRGVGMDVVEQAVEKMRGKVEIQSEKGRGTTVLMKLPLTLAIIDGMMVRAGDRDFIIPSVSVVESIRPDRSDCNTVANRGEMIRIRNTLYPLVRVHKAFDFEPNHADPWEAIVVVAESDGRRKCLMVDELVGKNEVVIKSLGERLKNIKGIAGGAILADGRVGLILDVAGLFEVSEHS